MLRAVKAAQAHSPPSPASTSSPPGSWPLASRGAAIKPVLLLNPAAGNGAAQERWEASRRAVESALGEVEVLTTRRRGHGPSLVRTAIEGGAERVFAFGGDGTWNDAVAGFFSAAPASRGRCALAPLPAGRARVYRLSVDGQDASGLFHAVLLANTETTGGGMKAAPGADLFDGLVEVLTVEGSSRAGLLRRLAGPYDGSHIGTRGVRMLRGCAVEIFSEDGPAALNIDGETAGRLPARFEVLAQSLPVLVPGPIKP